MKKLMILITAVNVVCAITMQYTLHEVRRLANVPRYEYGWLIKQNIPCETVHTGVKDWTCENWQHAMIHYRVWKGVPTWTDTLHVYREKAWQAYNDMAKNTTK